MNKRKVAELAFFCLYLLGSTAFFSGGLYGIDYMVVNGLSNPVMLFLCGFFALFGLGVFFQIDNLVEEAVKDMEGKKSRWSYASR